VRDRRFTLPVEATSDNSMIAASESLLGSTADRASLYAILADWWTEVLAQDSPGERWEREIAERLRQRCSALSGALQALGMNAPAALLRQVSGAENRAGAYLLGESAALVIRRNPVGLSYFDRAVHLMADCWQAIDYLMEALTRAPSWPEAANLLSPRTRGIDSLLGPQIGRRPPVDVLADGEQRARARGLLAYFWERQHEAVDLELRTLVRLALLARRDWRQLAVAAEELPLRELRSDLWRHLHLHEDRESILALITSAPIIFDAGEWTRCTTALAALLAAVAHADLLHARVGRQGLMPSGAQPGTAEQLKALEKTELPDWFRTVAQTAIARSDGRPLLLFFSAALIRQELSPQIGYRAWSSATIALEAFDAVISHRPTSVEMKDVGRLGTASGNERIDHVVYVVTAAVLGCDASSVWDWYCDLLQQNDEGICSQAKHWRRGLCYFAMAKILMGLPEPFDKWAMAWNSLFVTDRERARFTPLDQNALFPSVHLFRVGAELLRLQPDREGANKFRDEIRRKARQLSDNDPRSSSPIADDIYVDIDELSVRDPLAPLT
jgi:hypothetical protein